MKLRLPVFSRLRGLVFLASRISIDGISSIHWTRWLAAVMVEWGEAGEFGDGAPAQGAEFWEIAKQAQGAAPSAPNNQ